VVCRGVVGARLTEETFKPKQRQTPPNLPLDKGRDRKWGGGRLDLTTQEKNLLIKLISAQPKPGA
jgi:hypothetical protein